MSIICFSIKFNLCDDIYSPVTSMSVVCMFDLSKLWDIILECSQMDGCFFFFPIISYNSVYVLPHSLGPIIIIADG